MVLRIFIRRLLIIILLLTLLSSLSLRIVNFAKEELLVEKGSVKIYLSQNGQDIESKLIPFKNKISYGVEKRSTTQIKYYYVIREIQSETFYDFKNKFKFAKMPLTVLKDNGVRAEVKIGENYDHRDQAEKVVDDLYRATKITFKVAEKNTVSKYDVKYIEISNITIKQADKIAASMPQYEIKWIPKAN